MRSLDLDESKFDLPETDIVDHKVTIQDLKEKLANPNPEQYAFIRHAIQIGFSIDELHQITKIDCYFLTQFAELLALEKELTTYALYNLRPEIFRKAKQWGFSDQRMADLLRSTATQVRQAREKMGLNPCYAEVPSNLINGSIVHRGWIRYVTFQELEKAIKENESTAAIPQKIVVIGSGPNRIDYGGEYDYSLIHAVAALKGMGYDPIIMNNNPGALSTDPLQLGIYWESLNEEAFLDLIIREKPYGVFFQYRGELSPQISALCEQNGIKVLDSWLETDSLRNLESLETTLKEHKILRLPQVKVSEEKNALEAANKIGYPVIIRPWSAALIAEFAYDAEDIAEYYQRANKIEQIQKMSILVEKFLEDAIAVEVCCVSDGTMVTICGIMEQIEEAGINSADSALALPPYTIGEEILASLKVVTQQLAKRLPTKGLINFQYIIKHNTVYLKNISSGHHPINSGDNESYWNRLD